MGLEVNGITAVGIARGCSEVDSRESWGHCEAPTILDFSSLHLSNVDGQFMGSGWEQRPR